MIEKQTIEKIRSNLTSCSDEVLEQEFQQFFRKQSEVCDFVVDVTSSSRQIVRELSLYLSFVAYKALSEDTDFSQSITADMIAKASHRSQKWIQRLSALDADHFSSAATSLEVDSEPYLIGFVAAEVQGAITHGLSLDDEEKGAIFFVLKTIITSLSEDIDRT